MGRRHGVIGNRHGSALHFLELEPPIIELLLLLGPAPAAWRYSPQSAAPHRASTMVGTRWLEINYRRRGFQQE
jgi:hypothetical protein